MKLSTKGRYALRMMTDIAENQHRGLVSLKDIAARQEISKKYLEQIALHLNRCGMLRAVRGYQGGYTLTRPASDYSVSDILAAVEGSLAPVICLDEANVYPCPRHAVCKALPVWQGLDRLIAEYLGNITLADVIDGSIPAFSLVRK